MTDIFHSFVRLSRWESLLKVRGHSVDAQNVTDKHPFTLSANAIECYRGADICPNNIGKYFKNIFMAPNRLSIFFLSHGDRFLEIL